MADETKEIRDTDVAAPVVEIPGAERIKLEAEVEQRVDRRYQQLFLIWKQEEFSKFVKEQDEVIKTKLDETVEKWKKDQKPPTTEEIQQLLDQEYVTFTVPVVTYDDEGNAQNVIFTIRELPQKIEKRLYRQFRDKIMSKAGSLGAFTQANIDAPFETKIKNFLELFDESFELLAESVAMVLNPFEKRQVNGKPVDREWVQENISSSRQWQIMEAQIQVNRIKDFFSKLSQSGQVTQMTLEGLNYHQLLQQAR